MVALIILTLFHIIQLSQTNSIVETDVGTIRGLKSSDGDYNMYMGIPYADVDINNPFGASTPHPKFDGIFEANGDSSICPQQEEFNNTITGTLDCLHLNVYVPNSANSTNKLPVMVWIYGGGFTIGFSGRYLYGAKYLVRHNVILVTLNYRLGPYGFMCLDTPEVPGNQGLKDQLLALRWVKNNIEAFGGDADKITLFGNSAGARSAEFHLIYNNENENLFRSIIVQSGSAFTSQSTIDSNQTIPVLIAQRLGHSTNDLNEAISFLSKADTKSVIGASLTFNFRPCVEKQFPSVDNFITDFPINMKLPNANGVSIMTGFNSHEFLYLTVFDSDQSDTFTTQLRNSFRFSPDKLRELEYLIRRFYIGDEEIDLPAVWGIIDYRSDILYNYAADRSILRYMENGAENVFYYKFSYSGGRNFVKRKNNLTAHGAAHADEYGYLFEMEFMPEEPTPEDQLIIDKMTAMWTNFAKYGDPTPTISELLPVKWEGISRGSVYHYLNIDSELSAGKRPFHQRMAFWDLFYDSYAEYERGFSTSSGRSLFISSFFTSSIFFIVLNEIIL